MGEGHGAVRRGLRPPQLQHADVVVAGDEEGVVGGGLQVEGELAVVRHPGVQAAGELQDDALQDRVLLHVPHLDHLHVPHSATVPRLFLIKPWGRGGGSRRCFVPEYSGAYDERARKGWPDFPARENAKSAPKNKVPGKKRKKKTQKQKSIFLKGKVPEERWSGGGQPRKRLSVPLLRLFFFQNSTPFIKRAHR